jgi:hypothetical protein
MTSGPFRTADSTFERFGAVIAQYGRSKLAVLRSAGLVIALCLIGLSAFTSTVDLLEGGEPERSVASLVVGVVTFAAAAAVIVRALGFRGLHLELRQHGLIRRVGGVEVGMLWEDVAELRVARRSIRRWTRWGCSLRSGDGRRLELTDQLARIAEVCSRVEHESVARLLPRVLTDLEAGRAVAFGPFVVTRNGVEHRERHLAWAKVAQARVMGRLLVIGDATNGIRVLPKRDGIMAWAPELYAEVPNAAVLLAVVKRLASGSSAD